MRAGVGCVVLLCGLAWGNDFDDCILDHIQGAQGREVTRAIRESCLKTALPKVPARCYAQPAGSLEREFPVLTSLFYEMCLEQCARSSWWSRQFGNCRP